MWCWWRGGGGALTGQRSLVPEVGIFVFLMALDGLFEAVDALHAGRNTVDIAGGRAYRGCGMTVAVEGVGLSRMSSWMSHEWVGNAAESAG